VSLCQPLQSEELFPHHQQISDRKEQPDKKTKGMFRVADFHAHHQTGFFVSDPFTQISQAQVRAEESPRRPQSQDKVMISEKILDPKGRHDFLTNSESIQSVDQISRTLPAPIIDPVIAVWRDAKLANPAKQNVNRGMHA
jgi:hypothetical protein